MLDKMNALLATYPFLRRQGGGRQVPDDGLFTDSYHRQD